MPMLTSFLRSLCAVLILVGATAASAHASVVPPPSVPEPGLLVLLGSAAASAVLYARNRR